MEDRKLLTYAKRIEKVEQKKCTPEGMHLDQRLFGRATNSGLLQSLMHLK